MSSNLPPNSSAYASWFPQSNGNLWYAPPSNNPVGNLEMVMSDSIPRQIMMFRERERFECNVQHASQYYMHHLYSLESTIDQWLNNGAIGEPPASAYEYAFHNWTYSFLSVECRTRLNRIRLAIEDYDYEEQGNTNSKYWLRIEEKEKEAEQKKPICPLCRYDLRNDAFDVYHTTCGHVVHFKCLQSFHVDHNGSRCPICKTATRFRDGRRLFFCYE